MTYYIAKKTAGSFDRTIERVKEILSSEGFGILTEIDVKATMKEKLGEDFRDYRILGACNPPFAHKALSAEDKIGTMLPCNVIVQATDSNSVEIAAVDPVASMAAVDNKALKPIAEEIRSRLARVIEQI
ncbi:MAG: DUF302 domain-containing protein [Spirochaetota bacterium]